MIDKNSSNLGKCVDTLVQEAQRTSSRHKQNKSLQRHVIVKLPKHKTKREFLEKKERKKSKITFKGNLIK
jgi:hypothetical protein